MNTAIKLKHSNIQLTGSAIDRNGNKTIAVKLPNSRTFHIQITGVLNRTKSIIMGLPDGDMAGSLTDKDLDIIEHEIITYILHYSSAKHNDNLKIYKKC